METLVIDRRNVTLEYNSGCLLVRTPGVPPRSIPVRHLGQVICMHNTAVTTQAVTRLLDEGVDFIMANSRSASTTTAIFADQQRQAARRCQQYQLQQDIQGRVQISRALLRLKIRNSRKIVGHYQPTARLLAQLDGIIVALSRAEDMARLRGLEGFAQRLVFEHWRNVLPERLGFTARRRRPPTDPYNALLSLTSSRLHDEAARQIKIAGMDPMLGFFHELCSGRQSLACDLMEPLRPSMEAWCAQLLLDGILDLRHFSQSSTRCLLGKSGRNLFFHSYEERAVTWRHTTRRYAQRLTRHLDNCKGATL